MGEGAGVEAAGEGDPRGHRRPWVRKRCGDLVHRRRVWSPQDHALVCLTMRGSRKVRYFFTMSGGGTAGWGRSSSAFVEALSSRLTRRATQDFLGSTGHFWTARLMVRRPI